MRQAIGRNPTAAEVRGIEERLIGALRRLSREDRLKVMAMTPEQRLQEAARVAADELLIEARKKQQRTTLSVLAVGRLTDYVRSYPGRALDALDELLAFSAKAKGRVQSVETRAEAIRGDAWIQLNDAGFWDATSPTWLGLKENAQGVEQMVRALHGEQVTDAKVMRAAEQWRTVAEALRAQFNEAGGRIGKLDDWGMPHHHSSAKVAKAGRDKWVEDVMPHLRRDRYTNLDGTLMDDTQLRDFLGEAWLSIASQGANKLEPGRVRGTGMKANRHAEERQIHFQNADAYIEYQRQYGEKGLYEVLTSHVDVMARDLALVETFGPNPDHTFRLLLDAAQKEAATADPANVGKITRRVQHLEKLFNQVSGRTLPIADLRISRWSDNMKALLIASRLGSAIVSSITDFATMHVIAHINGLSHTQLLRNQLATLNPFNRQELRLARRTGLAMDTLIGSLNRFGADTMTTLPAKIASAVMRVQGLNAFTEANQRAFGITMMDALGSLTREKAFSELDDMDNRLLRSKGVTEADWGLWQKATLEDFGNGNDGVLTPESIAQIDDATVADVIRPRLNEIEAKADEAIDKLYERNATDQIWITRRIEKLQAARTRAADLLQQYSTRVKGKTDQTTQALRDRGELVKARAERAAVEADINAYLLAQKQQEQVRNFLYAVEEGAAAEGMMPRVERNVQAASRQRGGIGEKLGRRLAKSERAIADLEQRIKVAEADAQLRIDGKDKALADRLDAQAKELAGMVSRARERFEARRMQIDRIEQQVEVQKDRAIRQARRDAMLRLIGTVTEEVDMAVIKPGARERAAMYDNLQRGTISGELVRSFFLFKSFPIAMLMRHWRRASTLPGTGRAVYAASLIASTTLLGALVLQIKELINGRDPVEMSNAKFWGKSLAQGGALGLYGDFLYSSSTQGGRSLLASVAGPQIGLLEEAIALTHGNLMEAAQGEDTNFMPELTKFVKGITPGSNLWYARAAFDHLIFQQLQDYWSPGYIRNMKRRARKEFGQEYWWEPGEASPRRGPDFERALE
jgi:hypothetical protein